MKKTININLGGLLFHLDEDAYNRMTQYLNSIRQTFANEEGTDEIIADIETRIAEIFREKLIGGKEVINVADVEAVISIMGTPEDYAEAAEEPEEPKSKKQKSTYTESGYKGPKRLYRNPDDRILGGVASGIAVYFGMDPVWMRIILVVLFFIPSIGGIFLIYILLWIIIPEAKTTAQKLQMRGEAVTVSNIEKTVKEEMDRLNKKMSDVADRVEKSDWKSRLQDFFGALGGILVYVVEFFAKFIGVILLLVGIFVLLALFGLGSTTFVVSGITFSSLAPLSIAAALGLTATQKFLLLGGLLLLVAFPVVALITLGLRIIMGKRVKSRIVMSVFGVLATIGAIQFIVGVASLSREFKEKAEQEKTIALQNTDNPPLYIEMDKSASSPEDFPFWFRMEEQNFLRIKRLLIEPAQVEEPVAVLQIRSQGRTKKSALKKAQNIIYPIKQEDNRIILGEMFSLPRNEPYRMQMLDVKILLPEGTTFRVEESLIDVLHINSYFKNAVKGEAVGHVFEVKNGGFYCLDCPQQKWLEAEPQENDETDDDE